jgi:hypothetical protein
MRLGRYAALSVVVFGILEFHGCLVCAQASPKAIIVSPSSDANRASQQELELKGLKTSSEAIGVRVFLDPEPDSKLDANSKSYVGSVYFSHQKDPSSNKKEGNFVLPIRKKITGPTHIVICPISATGSPVSADVEVREARIRPADNSAFH